MNVAKPDAGKTGEFSFDYLYIGINTLAARFLGRQAVNGFLIVSRRAYSILNLTELNFTELNFTDCRWGKMNRSGASNHLSINVFNAVFITAFIIALPAVAADSEDNTIRPGVGLGAISLGMTAPQVRKISGNMDGKYTLPSGVKVEFAEWREQPPKQSPNLRFFYDKGGKLTQINCTAPVPATADGISCKSTMAEIAAAYKNLKRNQYKGGKKESIDYYDADKEGIAFEFKSASGVANKLYAVIVHDKGHPVMADSAETLVK